MGASFKEKPYPMTLYTYDPLSLLAPGMWRCDSSGLIWRLCLELPGLLCSASTCPKLRVLLFELKCCPPATQTPTPCSRLRCAITPIPWHKRLESLQRWHARDLPTSDSRSHAFIFHFEFQTIHLIDKHCFEITGADSPWSLFKDRHTN